MKQYSILSEAELFTNTFLEIPGVFSTYKLTTRDDNTLESTIRTMVYEIFKRYRTEVLNKFSSTWERDMRDRMETFTSYKLPKVPPKMMELAKSYYEIAESGFCFCVVEIFHMCRKLLLFRRSDLFSSTP